jgi:hypothetical protein
MTQIVPFNCSTCGALLTGPCAHCTAFYRGEQPIKPTRPDYMSGDERAEEIRKLTSKLSIPIDLVMARIDELVGRPVHTHELAERNFENILNEARTRLHPSTEQIINLIPEHKRIVIKSDEKKDNCEL